MLRYRLHRLQLEDALPEVAYHNCLKWDYPRLTWARFGRVWNFMRESLYLE